MRYALGAILVFGIAVVMAMVGRGGGNFYVPSLVLAGSSMHQAATTGQLILVCTALAALLVYGTKGVVDWKLALVIDPPAATMITGEPAPVDFLLMRIGTDGSAKGHSGYHRRSFRVCPSGGFRQAVGNRDHA